MRNSSDLTTENDALGKLLARRPPDDRSTEQIAKILGRIGSILKEDTGWHEKLRGVVSRFPHDQQEWAAVMALNRWHRKISQRHYPSVKNFLEKTPLPPDRVTHIIRDRIMEKLPLGHDAFYARKTGVGYRSSPQTPRASSVGSSTAPHDDTMGGRMRTHFSFLGSVSQEDIDTTREPARVMLQIQEKYFRVCHATILASGNLTQLQTFWEQFDQVTEWCKTYGIPSLSRFSFVEEEVRHILTEIGKTSKNKDIKDLDTFLSDEIQKWVKENNPNTYTRNQLLTSELSIAQLKKYIQQDQPQTRVIVRKHRIGTVLGRVNRERK